MTQTTTVLARSRLDCVDLTGELEAFIRDAGLHDGAVIAFCAHTTCALVINEWEDGALDDLRRRLDTLFPLHAYYAHDDVTRRTQNLTDDERRNGAAHVAQMVIGGTSHVIPVADGRTVLGEWQRLFLLELDEPKPRSIVFRALGSSTQSLVMNNQNARPAYSP
ncbi:MAG: secondary thiamine-phosphate synthase enzyme YjbQ [Actinomycetota bacterium]